jgi:hypothetical protein
VHEGLVLSLKISEQQLEREELVDENRGSKAMKTYEQDRIVRFVGVQAMGSNNCIYFYKSTFKKCL